MAMALTPSGSGRLQVLHAVEEVSALLERRAAEGERRISGGAG